MGGRGFSDRCAPLDAVLMIELNFLFGKSDHSGEAVGVGSSVPADSAVLLTVIAQVGIRDADNLAMRSSYAIAVLEGL